MAAAVAIPVGQNHAHSIVRQMCTRLVGVAVNHGVGLGLCEPRLHRITVDILNGRLLNCAHF